MKDFYNSRGGREFVDHTVPGLVRAVERLADAMEKSNEIAEREAQAKLANKMFSKLLEFAKSNECLDADVVQCQLRSLWTAYCIHVSYDVDTAPYDGALLEVWNKAVSVNPSNPFPDFDAFDVFMCDNLV